MPAFSFRHASALTFAGVSTKGLWRSREVSTHHEPISEELVERRSERHRVSLVERVAPRFTTRAARAGVSMRDRYGGESGPERALFGVGCDRSTVVKLEMSLEHVRPPESELDLHLLRTCYVANVHVSPAPASAASTDPS
jgi:hypothetical protein